MPGPGLCGKPPGTARLRARRTWIGIALFAGLLQALTNHGAHAHEPAMGLSEHREQICHPLKPDGSQPANNAAGSDRLLLEECQATKLVAPEPYPGEFLTEPLEDVETGPRGQDVQPSADEYLSEACAEGLISACEHIAGSLRLSTATEDQARARQMYAVICTSGSAVGCYETAWHYYDVGGAQATARARSLFTEACDAGHAESCLQAGDMRRTGEGGPRDPAGAELAYRKACLAGESLACQMRLQGDADLVISAPLSTTSDNPESQ